MNFNPTLTTLNTRNTFPLLMRAYIITNSLVHHKFLNYSSSSSFFSKHLIQNEVLLNIPQLCNYVTVRSNPNSNIKSIIKSVQIPIQISNRLSNL